MRIKHADVIARHLNVNHILHDDTDLYVRECFDEMLTNLAEIKNLIQRGLVPSWVFKPSMGYYCKMISLSDEGVGKSVREYALNFGMQDAVELHKYLGDEILS